MRSALRRLVVVVGLAILPQAGLVFHVVLPGAGVAEARITPDR